MTSNHVLARPITSRAQALAFVELLAVCGMAFHPDDNPREIVRAGDGSRTFSDTEAGHLTARVVELFSILGDDVYSAMMDADNCRRAAAPALEVMGTGGGCTALSRHDKDRDLRILITNDLTVPRPGERMEIGVYRDEEWTDVVAAWGFFGEDGPAFSSNEQAAQVAEAVLAYVSSK